MCIAHFLKVKNKNPESLVMIENIPLMVKSGLNGKVIASYKYQGCVSREVR
jgi:hypothetical protein